MIKAIFFDFDGTLYAGKVNAMTRKALEELRKKGILVFLATGRHPLDMISEEIDFIFDAYILLNGQLCTCGNKVIYQNTLPEEDIHRLLEFLDQEEISCMFLKQNEKFSNTDVIKWYRNANPMVKKLYEEGIMQVIAFANQMEEKRILDVMPGCKGTRWDNRTVDIINKNISKGTGVRKIMEQFHLNRNEVAAFGDGENDIEMLLYAGIGVAMGNASKEVKQIADYICESIDAGGVYQGLCHLGIL